MCLPQEVLTMPQWASSALQLDAGVMHWCVSMLQTRPAVLHAPHWTIVLRQGSRTGPHRLSQEAMGVQLASGLPASSCEPTSALAPSGEPPSGGPASQSLASSAEPASASPPEPVGRPHAAATRNANRNAAISKPEARTARPPPTEDSALMVGLP